jgi:excisionase family DNA binding protein
LKTEKFDPLAYIENAFLDKEKSSAAGRAGLDQEHSVTVNGEMPTNGHMNGHAKNRSRFRKTEMSAPRPRRAKEAAPPQSIDPELQHVWSALPRNVEFLCSFFDDSVTANYYRGEFKESRMQLVRRLLDPELSLEETSRLLGVCPATVRRYTNRGWLAHHRTQGGQRRFRLSDVVRFVETHGRFPEE